MTQATRGSEFESLNSLFIVLKREYKTILFATLFFLIFGFFYSLSIPKEYISTGKILPEVSHKPSNGMGALNQLLKKYNNNVDLHNTEITSPEIYAEIIKSDNFYNYILNKEVRTTTNKKISFKSYYDFNFKTDNKIKYYSIIQDIQKRIIITYDKRNNLIFITAKMQDPVVAADIANSTIIYLINYIIQYRTEKARQELHFIEDLEKKVSKDSSKSIELRKEIQNGLSLSAVQIKIKIQEDTPIIPILEKAQIPVMSNNSELKIIGGLTFIGFIIGVILAFLKSQNYKILFKEPKYVEVSKL